MEEWKSYKLGDIVKICSGLAYKADYLGHGDAILLGMGCVSFTDKFLKKGARSYNGESEDRFIVKPGDIVLATRQQSDNLPILGMPAIIPEEYQGKRLIAGSNLYIIRNESDIDNRFLYWLLKTPAYINHISSCKTGTTVRMITKKDIESFEFACPGKEERNRISDFLWSIEDKIDLNNRINHNLEEQADMYLWAMCQSCSSNAQSLSNICCYVNEKCNSSILTPHNYISTENMRPNREGISEASSIPNIKCTKYIYGDTLISNIRPYFKKIWFASQSGGCSNDILCFRSTNKTPSFLYHLLRSDKFFDFVMTGAKGSKMPRGDKNQIMTWQVPDVPTHVLSQIEGFLEKIDEQIVAKATENCVLELTRNYLLPELLKEKRILN